MSGITTHVLDTARGRPAEGIAVRLDFQTSADTWKEIGQGTTDKDGRVSTLVSRNVALNKGVYRLTFETGGYQNGFYPHISIVFRVDDPNQHYHVPLLLSPYGYSTYRGS